MMKDKRRKIIINVDIFCHFFLMKNSNDMQRVILEFCIVRITISVLFVYSKLNQYIYNISKYFKKQKKIK